MYVSTKELPAAVQSVLKSVGYGGKDIQVISQSTVDGAAYASDGQRGFVTIVNLDTGRSHTESGNWGGSNMFTPTLADDSREPITIPINGCVVKGSRGYPRTFATVYVHPDANRALGAASGDNDADSLSDSQQQCLYCYGSIKSGYRKDEMRRRNVTMADVESLIASGHLKENKAGAIQITTKGKNARTVTR